MPAGTSTENGDMIRNHESYSMESGDKTEIMNTLQDYESYGIVYHPKEWVLVLQRPDNWYIH